MIEEQPRRRARADADKQSRRRDLLHAAADAFARRPYAEVTVAEIARGAGLAKGTVYLYFQTKEELFLQLVLEQLGEWFAEIERELTESDALLPAEALARLLARTLVRREQLTRLLALLHVVLEQNCPADVTLAFKQQIAAQTAAAGALLERRYLDFEHGDGVRFLLHLHAAAVGLHQMANPAPAVAALLTRPELVGLRVDFASALQAHTAALLRGFRPRGT
jgi:AcrR family transcriptional regulator